MSDELTLQVEDSPLAQADEERLQAVKRARVLLDLDAAQGVHGDDRVLCERVAQASLIWEDEVRQIEKMWERLNREAALRGERWEGGSL
jgi:hypothetical protein